MNKYGVLLGLFILEEGWDSYGAKRISTYAMYQVMVLFSRICTVQSPSLRSLSEPFIAPLSNGGIQIEWETSYRKLHLRIPPSTNDRWEYMKQEEDLYEKVSDFGELDSAIAAFQIICGWLFEDCPEYTDPYQFTRKLLQDSENNSEVICYSNTTSLPSYSYYYV